MSENDIVERLRDPKVYIPGEELLHEAADTINALRAEVERLEGALNNPDMVLMPR